MAEERVRTVSAAPLRLPFSLGGAWLVSRAKVAGRETEPAAMMMRERRMTGVVVASPRVVKPTAKRQEQSLREGEGQRKDDIQISNSKFEPGSREEEGRGREGCLYF